MPDTFAPSLQCATLEPWDNLARCVVTANLLYHGLPRPVETPRRPALIARLCNLNSTTNQPAWPAWPMPPGETCITVLDALKRPRVMATLRPAMPGGQAVTGLSSWNVTVLLAASGYRTEACAVPSVSDHPSRFCFGRRALQLRFLIFCWLLIRADRFSSRAASLGSQVWLAPRCVCLPRTLARRRACAELSRQASRGTSHRTNAPGIRGGDGQARVCSRGHARRCRGRGRRAGSPHVICLSRATSAHYHCASSPHGHGAREGSAVRSALGLALPCAALRFGPCACHLRLGGHDS